MWSPDSGALIQRELQLQYAQGALKADDQPFEFLSAYPINLKKIWYHPEWQNSKFRYIYRFLVAKGYVQSSFNWLGFRKKLTIENFLWSCENVDARLYQIVPAVLIRFPTHFKTVEAYPAEEAAVMAHLQRGDISGPSYHGYPYELLRSWLWHQPTDVRCYRVNGSRLSVRLDPTATKALSQFAEASEYTLSEAIHVAIANLGV